MEKLLRCMVSICGSPGGERPQIGTIYNRNENLSVLKIYVYT